MHWSAFDPWLLTATLAVGLLYGHGAQRLRGSGAVSRRHLTWFWLGMTFLMVSVAPPLEQLSGRLLSAHMVQHLLMVVVAAPLIAAGRPQIVVPAAFPPAARQRLQRWRVRLRASSSTGARPAALVALAAAHIVVVWAWHVPAAYEAALVTPWLHLLEHVTFLATATAVWVVLLTPTPRARLGHGLGVLSMAAILMSGGALGALLTLVSTPLYGHYTGSAQWGLSALQDQQLAGAIMWVPGGVFYGVVCAVLLVKWLRLLDGAAADGVIAGR